MGSDRVDVERSAVGSDLGLRAELRPVAGSGLVAVRPSAADSGPGLHAELPPRMGSGRPDVEASAVGSDLGLRAELRPVAGSGLVGVRPSAAAEDLGLRAELRPRAVSGHGTLARSAAASPAGPRVDRTRAGSDPGVPAAAGAAPLAGRGASVAAHPDLGATHLAKGGSGHCPAVVVHDDPAPARVVEVEVGGVAVGAERAPPSAG